MWQLAVFEAAQAAVFEAVHLWQLAVFEAAHL